MKTAYYFGHVCRTVCPSGRLYEGESKSKSKIHLMALVEVTVGNFTYHFST